MITWDDKGAVSVEGKPLQGSSITDLVNDVVRNRKGFSPTGRNDFTQVLAKLNTPEDFIRNDDRRKLLSEFKKRPTQLPITPENASSFSLFPSPPTRPRKPYPSTRQRGFPGIPRRELDWISYD